MSSQFESIVLPHLLNVAEWTLCKNDILSISLYGSANYTSFQNISSSSVQESDYDIWIIFKEGAQSEAKKFASSLFQKDFTCIPRDSPCILYDKFLFDHQGKTFLLAPIITTEETYHYIDSKNNREELVIPWYRCRQRDRDPIVPIKGVASPWQSFDMQQTYLTKIDLWRLSMPVIVPIEKTVALGTFIEGSLTGSLFWGNNKHLLKNLTVWFADISRLRDYSGDLLSMASDIYQTMTVSLKAGDAFSDHKIREISGYLSQ